MSFIVLTPVVNMVKTAKFLSQPGLLFKKHLERIAGLGNDQLSTLECLTTSILQILGKYGKVYCTSVGQEMGYEISTSQMQHGAADEKT